MDVIRDVRLQVGASDADTFTVSYWKVDRGATVRSGDELVVLESVEEKVAVAVAAPCAGVLAEIVAAEGSAVADGALLGRIDAK